MVASTWVFSKAEEELGKKIPLALIARASLQIAWGNLQVTEIRRKGLLIGLIALDHLRVLALAVTVSRIRTIISSVMCFPRDVFLRTVVV